MENNNKAVQRVLDAMNKLEIEPLYDEELGYYVFSHQIIDMFLSAKEEKVCIAAEFDTFDSFVPLFDPICKTLNRDGDRFIIAQSWPGVGYVARLWHIDEEQPLPVIELEKMLDELIQAREFVTDFWKRSKL